MAIDCKMKTKLIILLLLASASLGRATLIDLTPGGFSSLNPPPVVIDWENTIFLQNILIISHADISGNTVNWSPFFLGPPDFNLDPEGLNANISWNVANIHDGSLLYVVVGGLKNGSSWNNLYQVPLDEIVNGSDGITIDGLTTISAINFFGHVPVPETINTLLAFAGTTAILVILRRRVGSGGARVNI